MEWAFIWAYRCSYRQPLTGWHFPSAYTRSAAVAWRNRFAPKGVAARAADVASLSSDMGRVYLLYMAKAGHIRRPQAPVCKANCKWVFICNVPATGLCPPCTVIRHAFFGELLGLFDLTNTSAVVLINQSKKVV